MTQIARTILTAGRASLTALGDLMLPASCGACGCGQVSAGGLCDECGKKLLEAVALHYCPRCGATVGPNIPVREDGCWACPSPLPRFDEVIRIGPYGQPLRKIVQQLKYHRSETMLARLGELLSHAIEARTTEAKPELIMPVAMHWRRRLLRGYDHARTLANALARRLDLPLGDELIRTRYTPLQVRLSRTKRIANVRGAFGLRDSKTIEGARVLLIDDVTTTGATANEAARALLKGGAQRVTLAVIAKAEPPSAYSSQIT